MFTSVRYVWSATYSTCLFFFFNPAESRHIWREHENEILRMCGWMRGKFYQSISLSLRRRQQPTTSQPHRRSCSSGTGSEWISIKERTLQVWRRRSNSTQRTTRETARTPTFQRDTWVDNTPDTFLHSVEKTLSWEGFGWPSAFSK